MRILFVENKYVTRTWEAVARVLVEDGFEVHWLVQNPLFAPSVGTLHRIPFPKADDLVTADRERFSRVRDQDRGINYFGGDDRHYAYYAARIGAVLDSVVPDLVVGESTLFHELLTLQLTRERGIVYLFPTGVRYPSDRFGFFLGETQELAFGSGEIMPDAELDRLLAIYERRCNVPLFYSHLARTGLFGRLRTIGRALGKGLLAWRSRLAGERFNTPSLSRKASIERRKAALIRSWDEVAATKKDRDGRFKILFPLQMLPESTLECYGYDWRDQLDTFRRLVEASDGQTTFLVKTNPVPRYEITPDFLRFVTDHPRVRPLASMTRMDDIFWSVDLIATVTGTVAIEAFLSGRPFVTLSPSLVTPFAPGRTQIGPDELRSVVDAVRQGRWSTSSPADRRRFLAYQVASSHSGIVADTFHYPVAIEAENVAGLARGFRRVRSQLEARPART